MTTYTPPAEAVEAAARAICEHTDEPDWSAVVIARAALTAAGPIIAAEALREAAETLRAEDLMRAREVLERFCAPPASPEGEGS